MVWTFVHKTNKNQVPAALLSSPPTGTLGEGLGLRPSPHHTPEPARQQHRKCQPLSPEQLAPITQTQLEILSWGEAMPGLIGNPTLKQRQPCSRTSTQHSGWSGAGGGSQRAGWGPPGREAAVGLGDLPVP